MEACVRRSLQQWRFDTETETALERVADIAQVGDRRRALELALAVGCIRSLRRGAAWDSMRPQEDPQGRHS
eukprot:467757-Pyramimonas_sp.AAC.1